MSEPAPDLDAPETPDVAMLVAERQLCLLQELSEIGMDLARALRDKAAAEAAAPVGETGKEIVKPTTKPTDPAAAFVGLPRGIRLPLRETVERLCADLQITPDWSRWVGDDWIPDEPFYRFKCSGYWPPSRKPSTADNDPGPSATDTGSYRLE